MSAQRVPVWYGACAGGDIARKQTEKIRLHNASRELTFNLVDYWEFSNNFISSFLFTFWHNLIDRLFSMLKRFWTLKAIQRCAYAYHLRWLVVDSIRILWPNNGFGGILISCTTEHSLNKNIERCWIDAINKVHDSQRDKMQHKSTRIPIWPIMYSHFAANSHFELKMCVKECVQFKLGSIALASIVMRFSSSNRQVMTTHCSIYRFTLKLKLKLLSTLKHHQIQWKFVFCSSKINFHCLLLLTNGRLIRLWLRSVFFLATQRTI